MKKAKIIIAVILTVIALISASAIYVVAATDEAVEGYYTFKKFNSKSLEEAQSSRARGTKEASPPPRAAE